MKRVLLLVCSFVLAACQSVPPQPQPTALSLPVAASPTPSPFPPLTATATAVPAPTNTPTPDPYLPYTIEHLRGRAYGGGQVEIVETMNRYAEFTRYLVRYPSDGLTIYGFMNVPTGEGAFPVVIALHGYINPSVYNTLDYTTRYADALARAGYLVLHPNLRGFRPSDDGDDSYRVGMAIDVLNLIGHLKSQAGQPGPLQAADAQRIGLWGHSMGGGISTRVVTVSPDVRAAVLYGAMSGDEYKNFEAILRWSEGERGSQELATPSEQLDRISPEKHFENITAAVSIHHGDADLTVPVEWSQHTCSLLSALGKTVECVFYDGLPHTFSGRGDVEFIQNTLNFYATYLRGP